MQEGYLKTTREAICPNKSFAYAILFRFNSKGEFCFESVVEVEAYLLVKNENKEREDLKIIELNKGMDTLGILLVPDSSIKDEYNYLCKKHCHGYTLSSKVIY